MEALPTYYYIKSQETIPDTYRDIGYYEPKNTVCVIDTGLVLKPKSTADEGEAHE